MDKNVKWYRNIINCYLDSGYSVYELQTVLKTVVLYINTLPLPGLLRITSKYVAIQ